MHEPRRAFRRSVGDAVQLLILQSSRKRTWLLPCLVLPPCTGHLHLWCYEVPEQSPEKRGSAPYKAVEASDPPASPVCLQLSQPLFLRLWGLEFGLASWATASSLPKSCLFFPMDPRFLVCVEGGGDYLKDKPQFFVVVHLVATTEALNPRKLSLTSPLFP